jgi:ABC-type Fe3+/spermidine/putrescine transport system ATPase subunit
VSRLAFDRIVRRHAGSARPAVDGVDLVVEEGTVTALVGPSGCGKSTLLALAAGLQRPDAGRVLIDGQDQAGVPPERRGAVLMAQAGLLFPHMTVAENVGFGLTVRRRPAAEVRAAVAAALALVRLEGLGDRRPASLSGGQAQRVALARALVVRPRVLLLDEPLSDLDPVLRRDLAAEIRDLQRRTGTTTVFVTHDPAEALAVADRLAVMDGGRIAEEGTPEDLWERPATRAAARLLGAETILDGEVRGGVLATALGPVALEEPGPDGPAAVALRPEAIRLAPAGEGAPARVVSCAYRGGHTRLVARAGEATVVLSVPAGAAPPAVPGTDIRLRVAPGRYRRLVDSDRER